METVEGKEVKKEEQEDEDDDEDGDGDIYDREGRGRRLPRWIRLSI